MRNRTWLLWAAVVITGCAHVEAPPHAPSRAFQLHAQGGAVVYARFDPESIDCPAVSIARTSEGLRGTAYSVPLDVKLEAGEVHGILGTTPVQLTVAEEGAGFHATGLFGGQLSDFHASPDVIRGEIAGCGYDLAFQDDRYVGRRACSSEIETVSLEVPSALTVRSRAEVATSLALLLGNARGSLASPSTYRLATLHRQSAVHAATSRRSAPQSPPARRTPHVQVASAGGARAAR